MVSPYSAGTLTLQEAPSFAWRTNGLTFSRKPREQTVAILHYRCARIGGCNVLLARRCAERQGEVRFLGIGDQPFNRRL